jgi:hypothetical protein
MHSFDLILTLTGGFAGALVFGYLTQRLVFTALSRRWTDGRLRVRAFAAWWIVRSHLRVEKCRRQPVTLPIAPSSSDMDRLVAL